MCVVFSLPVLAINWTVVLGANNWYGVAMSSDGQIQTLCTEGDTLYVSNDSGQSWTPKHNSSSRWDVAMSSNGTYQTATEYYGGRLIVSNDSGQTWTPKGISGNWWDVAISSNGTLQTATLNGGNIYISSDYGQTWTSKASVNSWRGVAMSADGQYRTACTDTYQKLYVSNDSGQTWSPQGSIGSWEDVAMSSNGRFQTAIRDDGPLSVSSDYGLTWTDKGASSNYNNVAMSSTGQIQIAGNINTLYISTDYGQTWNDTGSGNWRGLAMSSNASIITAINYTSQVLVSYNNSLENVSVPISTKFENGTTIWAAVSDIHNIPNATLVTDQGRIQWPGTIDAEGQDFDAYVKIGNKFVSLNMPYLNPTLNNTAHVQMWGIDCSHFKLYYSSSFYPTAASIIAHGGIIATQANIGGDCTDPSICTNVACSANTLTFTAQHFDGFAEQDETPPIPEFGTWALLLALGIMALGVINMRRR
jgi:photosystem II stability/assembly factor-like uncharacterized protein